MAFEEFNNCCDNQTNIVWLNRQGGYQNYIFSGVKTFQIDGGTGKTFKQNLIKKYCERKDVYEGKVLTTSAITKAHVDYIDSLKYSIQAWEWDESDNSFTEILLDTDSFVKYTSRDNAILDVAIKYIYAKEIKIQTQ